VLERTKTMFDYAQQNFAGFSYASIPSGFINGKFAMTADGTWDETRIASAAGADPPVAHAVQRGGLLKLPRNGLDIARCRTRK
jgi:ABC-type glycerol-3-phosphate transport system substrate-binding protein